jgi:hypothetical protein
VNKLDVIGPRFKKLHERYFREGNGIIGTQFPVMLKNIIQDHADIICALKTSYRDKDGIKKKKIVFRTDSAKMAVKYIVERSFLEFYAWMSDKKYNFYCVRGNRTTCLEGDDLLVKIRQYTLYRVVMPQVRLAILRYGRFFPVKFSADECKNLSLFSLLPSCLETSCDNGVYNHPLYKDYRLSITQHGPEGSNEARDHIYMWIYAADETARQEFINNHGEVHIDGIRFILIIYNPNADFLHTRFKHIRGCWFALLNHIDDGGLQYSILTRSLLLKLYKDVTISTVATFQVDDANGPSIVNFTYDSPVVPPTMPFPGLMNEFDKYEKFVENEERGIVVKKGEDPIGTKVVSNEEFTELFFEKYGHQENAKNAIVALHTILKDIVKVSEIQVYDPINIVLELKKEVPSNREQEEC